MPDIPTLVLKHSIPELSNDFHSYRPESDWLDKFATLLAPFNDQQSPLDDQKSLGIDEIKEQLSRHVLNPLVKANLYIIYGFMTEELKNEAMVFTDAVKQKIAILLLEGLKNCSNGILERSYTLCTLLLSSDNIQSYLQQYRTELVDKIARAQFGSISPGMQVHELERYRLIAESMGYGVPATEGQYKRRNLPVKDSEKQQIHDVFARSYQLPNVLVMIEDILRTKLQEFKAWRFNNETQLYEIDNVELLEWLKEIKRTLQFDVSTSHEYLIYSDDDYKTIGIKWSAIRENILQKLISNKLIEHNNDNPKEIVASLYTQYPSLGYEAQYCVEKLAFDYFAETANVTRYELDELAPEDAPSSEIAFEQAEKIITQLYLTHQNNTTRKICFLNHYTHYLNSDRFSELQKNKNPFTKEYVAQQLTQLMLDKETQIASLHEYLTTKPLSHEIAFTAEMRALIKNNPSIISTFLNQATDKTRRDILECFDRHWPSYFKDKIADESLGFISVLYQFNNIYKACATEINEQIEAKYNLKKILSQSTIDISALNLFDLLFKLNPQKAMEQLRDRKYFSFNVLGKHFSIRLLSNTKPCPLLEVPALMATLQKLELPPQLKLELYTESLFDKLDIKFRTVPSIRYLQMFHAISTMEGISTAQKCEEFAKLLEHSYELYTDEFKPSIFKLACEENIGFVKHMVAGVQLINIRSVGRFELFLDMLQQSTAERKKNPRLEAIFNSIKRDYLIDNRSGMLSYEQKLPQLIKHYLTSSPLNLEAFPTEIRNYLSQDSRIVSEILSRGSDADKKAMFSCLNVHWPEYFNGYLDKPTWFQRIKIILLNLFEIKQRENFWDYLNANTQFKASIYENENLYKQNKEQIDHEIIQNYSLETIVNTTNYNESNIKLFEIIVKANPQNALMQLNHAVFNKAKQKTPVIMSTLITCVLHADCSYQEKINILFDSQIALLNWAIHNHYDQIINQLLAVLTPINLSPDEQLPNLKEVLIKQASVHSAIQTNPKALTKILDLTKNSDELLEKLLLTPGSFNRVALYSLIDNIDSLDVVLKAINNPERPIENRRKIMRQILTANLHNGQTLLHLAAINNHRLVQRIINELISLEYPPKELLELVAVTNLDNETPLHTAAKTNVASMHELLEVHLKITTNTEEQESIRRALLFATTNDGKLPLHCALEHHPQAMPILMNSVKSDELMQMLTIKTNNQETALHFALLNKSNQNLSQVLQYIKQTATSSNESLIMIKEMLSTQTKTDAKTPLDVAAANARIDEIKKNTPFCIAARL